MTDVLTKILENPATNYLISFGGLGLILTFAINWAHKSFAFSDKQLGIATLLAGAVGGLLLQETGMVSLPGDHNFVSCGMAAFAGAITSAAAASFSPVDLRETVLKSKDMGV